MCKARHNTLLHLVTSITDSRGGDEKHREDSASAVPTTVVTHSSSSRGGEDVMLSTAVVHAYDNSGSRRPCRVLLDCRSQANFVSRSFLNLLGIESQPSSISITGINNTVTRTSQTACVRLHLRTSVFSTTIKCIVADQVTHRPAYT